MLAFILSIFGIASLCLGQFSPTWLPETFVKLEQWPTLFILVALSLVLLMRWSQLHGMKKQSLTIKEYEKQTLQQSKTLESLHSEIHKLKSEVQDSLKLRESLDKKIIRLETESGSLSEELDIAKSQRAVLENQLKVSQANSSEGDVLALLSSLQKKGRFLDFIQGDISQYPDAQVGAAARVVHQGCRSALGELLDIQPIHNNKEGDVVDLNTDAQDLLYSFSGEPGEQTPTNGRLIHKGWKTSTIKLPKRTAPIKPDLLVISPAEIQL